jgi:hypothetical protein
MSGSTGSPQGSQTLCDAVLHVLEGGDRRGQVVGQVGASDEGLLYLEFYAQQPGCHGLDQMYIEIYLQDREVNAQLQGLKQAGRARAFQQEQHT